MTHVCENCDVEFPIKRHENRHVGAELLLVRGTGKNMVYKGEMNREYAMCPVCGMVEHQFSAEARDQSE